MTSTPAPTVPAREGESVNPFARTVTPLLVLFARAACVAGCTRCHDGRPIGNGIRAAGDWLDPAGWGSRGQLQSAGGRSTLILLPAAVVGDKDTDDKPEAPECGRDEAKDAQHGITEELERGRHAHQQ